MFRNKNAQIIREILAGEAARLAEARKLELEFARLEMEAKLKAKEIRQARKLGRPPMNSRSLFEKAS